jgi:hypothetical protein
MKHILCKYTGRRLIIYLTDVEDSCKLIQTRRVQTLFVQTTGTTASRGKGQGCGTTAVPPAFSRRRECAQFVKTCTGPNGDNCRLSHTRRASRMRQAARLLSSGPSSPEASSKEDVDDSADSETLVGGTCGRPLVFCQANHRLQRTIQRRM